MAIFLFCLLWSALCLLCLFSHTMFYFDENYLSDSHFLYLGAATSDTFLELERCVIVIIFFKLGHQCSIIQYFQRLLLNEEKKNKLSHIHGPPLYVLCLECILL